jgi:FkbM family methyltransferase
MMIRRPSLLKKFVRSRILQAFAHLENNGNAEFSANGEEQFVNGLFEYLEKIDREKIVLFDIGANIGAYTQMLLDKTKNSAFTFEIHAFEPTKACFEVLEKKFSGVAQVILNRKAVSNAKGAAEIYYDKSKSGLASMYQRNLGAYKLRLDRTERIETVRLDEYLAENDVRHIHFMKIDVEGHEIAVLEGLGSYLSGDFIDVVQFEYGGANLDSHTSLLDLYVVFENANFVVAKIMRKVLEIRAYEPWMDNFSYANYVAISRRVVNRLT